MARSAVPLSLSLALSLALILVAVPTDAILDDEPFYDEAVTYSRSDHQVIIEERELLKGTTDRLACQDLTACTENPGLTAWTYDLAADFETVGEWAEKNYVDEDGDPIPWHFWLHFHTTRTTDKPVSSFMLCLYDVNEDTMPYRCAGGLKDLNEFNMNNVRSDTTHVRVVLNDPGTKVEYWLTIEALKK